MVNVPYRIYTYTQQKNELRWSGGYSLGPTDLGTTRFGNDWALICLKEIYRTLNCTSCLGNYRPNASISKKWCPPAGPDQENWSETLYNKIEVPVFSRKSSTLHKNVNKRTPQRQPLQFVSFCFCRLDPSWPVCWVLGRKRIQNDDGKTPHMSTQTSNQDSGGKLLESVIP